jgi:hypothetical protein
LSRPFDRVAVVVAAVSTAVFARFLTLGRPDLLATRPMADLFDIQARNLLDGHLSGPRGTFGLEEFVIDGRSLTYFGLFPSIIRMPVLAVTDSLDGRLTTLSMLVAYVVALAATAQLIRRVHDLLSPGPWTRHAVVVSSALLAVVGLGSNLMFLGATAWVYTEASLWGAAAALASFAAVVGFLQRPDRLRHVVIAGLWAAVAWLSRGSVGMAPAVALGLLGVAHLTGWRVAGALAPRPDTESAAPATAATARPRDIPTAAALLTAAVLPALAFVVVNLAKFGSPLIIPFGRQSAAAFPTRAAALDEYGGNLFSLRLVLPNLVHMLRPDLVEPTRMWPLVDFTRHGPPTFGGVVFDTVESTVGLPTLMPALLVLGAVGAVAILRPRPTAAPPGDGLSAARLLRPLLIGGAIAAAVPLTIAFVAQRYATDAMPLLITAACAGAVAFEHWWTPRAGVRVHVVVAALGVLAVVGIYVTSATTWLYGRLEAPPDAATRAAALEVQAAASDLPGVGPVPVTRLDRLPARVDRAGEPVVVGSCEGLYWGQYDGWFTVEATPARGHHRLRLSLPSSLREPVALLALGGEANHVAVGVQSAGDGRVRFVVSTGVATTRGEPVALGPGPDHELDVWAEPGTNSITVDVDGRRAFQGWVEPPSTGAVAVGANPFAGPIADPPPGTVTELPVATPACDRLLAQG